MTRGACLVGGAAAGGRLGGRARWRVPLHALLGTRMMLAPTRITATPPTQSSPPPFVAQIHARKHAAAERAALGPHGQNTCGNPAAVTRGFIPQSGSPHQAHEAKPCVSYAGRGSTPVLFRPEHQSSEVGPNSCWAPSTAQTRRVATHGGSGGEAQLRLRIWKGERWNGGLSAHSSDKVMPCSSRNLPSMRNPKHRNFGVPVNPAISRHLFHPAICS